MSLFSKTKNEVRKIKSKQQKLVIKKLENDDTQVKN